METRKALISVWDKTGVLDLAKGLAAHGYEIVSSSGTAKYLEEGGVKVTEVVDPDSRTVEYHYLDKKLKQADVKLIRYLAREKHVLPFRHPTITLRCKAPLFLARQLGKHQVGMSWSEESRRYIDNSPEFFWPEAWRERADNVKQGSGTKDLSGDYITGAAYTIDEAARGAVGQALRAYTEMLGNGVAPELARMILPQNMYVNWVWTGSLLSWVHMIKLRTGHGAQREAIDFAKLVEEVVKPLYPVSYEALMAYP